MQYIAITGGPGGGKTAVLDIAERTFCRHVAVLPESAGILFSGGFPRKESVPARCAAQRGIYFIQVELERMMREENSAAVVLCDRGTIDGFAYWPTEAEDYWKSLQTTRATQLARYDAVIHLMTPNEEQGYNHENVLRTETASVAQIIDKRILEAWEGHPRRFVIPPNENFMHKAQDVMACLESLVPRCCRENAD